MTLKVIKLVKVQVHIYWKYWQPISVAELWED